MSIILKTIIDRQFYSLVDRGDTLLIENIQVERCEFDFCGLCETIDINRRTTVRNVHINNCMIQNHTSIGPAILEDVFITDLKIQDLFILWDPLFKHVTLKGKIGDIKVNSVAGLNMDIKPEIQASFNAAKKLFYNNVNWAIDISEAKLRHLELWGVPSHLVRRDPESQVIVKRIKALQANWREKLHPENTEWPHWIEMLLQFEEPDIILAAPKALPRKKYEKLLDGLKDLREIGLAEPD